MNLSASRSLALLIVLVSGTSSAGDVVSGLSVNVGRNDVVTVNNAGSSAFPGGVGSLGTDAYVNGWSVTSGEINWTDTNNTHTLRMNSSGIEVTNHGGVANANGNKSGSVQLAGTAALGALLRTNY